MSPKITFRFVSERISKDNLYLKLGLVKLLVNESIFFGEKNQKNTLEPCRDTTIRNYHRENSGNPVIIRQS